MYALALLIATLPVPETPAAPAATMASQPASGRAQALLEKFRQLSPEARAQVIALMESAVAQASPSARPALKDLLRQVKALETTAGTSETETSVERFLKLNPDQRRKVLETMELEAAKAPPEARAGYTALLTKLRNLADKTPDGMDSSRSRIRSSVASYRLLDAEGRAQVLSRLTAEAAKAEPGQRRILKDLIQRLKAISSN